VHAKELGYTRDTERLEKDIDDVLGLVNGLMNAERRKAGDAR
jgi:hypothetical protein